jgi:[acyl-carrier-protein] S-malonyltransferase
MVTVIGLPFEQVETLCDECRQPDEILICCQPVAYGSECGFRRFGAACERLAVRAPEVGASGVNRLAVAGAFHTSIMESAVPKLAAVLESVVDAAVAVPCVFQCGRPRAYRAGRLSSSTRQTGLFAGIVVSRV